VESEAGGVTHSNSPEWSIRSGLEMCFHPDAVSSEQAVPAGYTWSKGRAGNGWKLTRVMYEAYTVLTLSCPDCSQSMDAVQANGWRTRMELAPWLRRRSA
jgi:hypothetical protein